LLPAKNKRTLTHSPDFQDSGRLGADLPVILRVFALFDPFE
jgi:hypothetical protein